MFRLTDDHYLLRTTLFPVQQADLCFRDDAITCFQHPLFQYGLYLSSGSLYQEYQKQLQDGVLTHKMQQTLRKYWLRASTRCTPYANFAGCTLGRLDDQTDIQLAAPDKHTESCRLDMDLLYKVLEQLYNDPLLVNAIRFFPNNTGYVLGDKYRYVRYKVSSGKRTYFLSEATHTAYLKEILSASVKGTTLTALAAVLTLYDITPEEAFDYLRTLVSNQVLTSELEPCVSGDQPFTRLYKSLQGYEAGACYLPFLAQVHEWLQKDQFHPARLEQVKTYLSVHRIDHSSVSTLFQSDLTLHTLSNSIGVPIAYQLLEEINTIAAAIYKKPVRSEQLEHFKNEFFRRYEMQEIPLCEALDVESGIGYGNYSNHINAFISDVAFGKVVPEEKVSPFTDLITSLQEQRNSRDVSPIHLDTADLAQLRTPGAVLPALPQFATIMGSLYGSPDTIDASTFHFHLKGVHGTSSANMLARFCHADPDIYRWVKSLTTLEDAALPAHIVYAEIIHLPQERTGNILVRPVLRQYEIPYQGQSGADQEQQLPVTDLLLSVRNNQLVLRSKRLNKYLIPRLTTAHNFSFDSLPIYKFLCDLQFQDTFPTISFELPATTSIRFSPRIVYQHLILRRATWRLTKEDIKELPKSEDGLTAFILQMRNTLQLPERILYLQSDNELLIDCRYNDAFRLLVGYINKYGSVLVCEFLGDAYQYPVKGSEGHHCNELLIPVNIPGTQGYPLPLPARGSRTRKPVKRIFTPGDEWLYFKIYGSANTIEAILQLSAPRLVRQLLRQGHIQSFFFLRYADPAHHLRIRFRLTGGNALQPVIQSVNKEMDKWLKHKKVTTVQIDTYVREIERYGADSIELSEILFYHDSQAILELLGILREDPSETLRWQAGLVGIDAWLNDFSMDLPQKVELMDSLQKGFLAEFGGGPPLQHSLNDKYRTHKEQLFQLFSSAELSAPLLKCRQILHTRSLRNGTVVQSLRTICTPKACTELLASYLHMFIIRLFTAENRKYELTLYSLLLKYYKAATALQKQQHKQLQ